MTCTEATTICYLGINITKDKQGPHGESNETIQKVTIGNISKKNNVKRINIVKFSPRLIYKLNL